MNTVAAIYGHHVLHGTATFETEPPTTEDMRQRRIAIAERALPYLVAEGSNGRVLGYAYAGSYRPRPAYRNTLENSVYVSEEARGRGIGRRLLEVLIQECAALGYRQMVAVIGDSANEASIRLHKAFGFEPIGTLRSVGRKHGRGLDTVLMQKALGDGDGTAPVTEQPGPAVIQQVSVGSKPIYLRPRQSGNGSMGSRFAIVGGGPKAVAIATKAKILQEEGLLDCEVHVFEAHEIGASWTGRHGYTDGEQALCTPAEKDLGFPYVEMPGAPDAAEKMMARFSWGTFKASRGYADWVDRGRPRASHGEFAEYLKWACARSGAIQHHGEVTRLEEASDGWKVEWKEAGAGAAEFYEAIFDGVVVTGHGPARTMGPTSSPRMLDGKGIWLEKERTRVLRLLHTQTVSEDTPLVVIGSGDAAAAVLAWLVREGFRDLPIHLLAEQATFYSRGNSLFENRLFSDSTQWQLLTHTTRKAFFDRLTRGVVWDAVMEELVHLSALNFIDGRATSIVPTGAGNLTVQWQRNLTKLELDFGGEETGETEAGLVINATGFDNWWFLNLLPPGTVPSNKSGRDAFLKALMHGMGEDLAFGDGWTLPRLHAPFQSMLVGPGFASLLALGDMADRVLRPYMK